MNTLVTVIYGIPLDRKMSALINHWEMENDARYNFEDGGPCGFIKLASRGDITIGYSGVVLGEVKVGDDPVDVSKLKLSPTKEQVASATARFVAIPYELRDMCRKPGVYLIWHSR